MFLKNKDMNEEKPFAEVAKEAVGDKEAVIVDVRRDDEWAAGHADRAVHWELAKLEAGQMPDIPKDKKIYTYCAAGKRAGQAADILKANGWTDVHNLGGLPDWKEAGGQVII